MSFADTRLVAALDINQVLADNLRHYMDKQNLKQDALASRCGVSQRTISNYLNPGRRNAGSSGKPGSAKLTELQMLADGLGVKAWELVRQYEPGEREARQALESVYLQLRASAAPPIVETRKAA